MKLLLLANDGLVTASVINKLFPERWVHLWPMGDGLRIQSFLVYVIYVRR